MQNISYQKLIEKEELQRLQDEFCAVTKIALFCLNAEGEQITSLSGMCEVQTILEECRLEGMIRSVLERVEEGSLEDLVIEEVAEKECQLAAIAVRMEENTIFYWVSACLGRTEGTTQFSDALDLLRDISHTVIVTKMSCFSAEAESRRSHYVQQEMSRDLRTVEAMTEIVQLLDSDRTIDAIMDKWLFVLGNHLQVDTAQIFRVHEEENTMDVVCEWKQYGQVTFFDRTAKIPLTSYLATTKPIVISQSKIQKEYRKELEQIGLKAVMVFPILNSENAAEIVLSLNHRNEEHNWSTAEIKFTSDAVKVLQSILTKRMQKNSLAGSHAALESTLDNVGCAICVADRKTGEILFANRNLKNTFASELQEDCFLELLNKDMPRDKSGGTFEFFYEEEECWYDLIYKEISWVDGRKAILYSLYDITDRKLYQRKIEQQVYTDFLTGLYNRMCCEKDLAKQIDAAKKNGTTGAILYLDLDNFKHINDGLGHQYGDVLLKAISSALKMIEGIQDSCYRMGGDEFVIVIPPEYYTKCDKIIEEIRQIFNRPWYLKDGDYYCTMSMGIVMFPNGSDSVADLVKKADIAMYEAKKSGKNRMVLYQEGIDSESGRRLDIEKNMRDATETGYKEFEVFYQPIINVENGEERCTGAEALIRWNSEKLGFIPPVEFIPLAEYLGLITPIGNYVLKEACEHCKAWNDNGYPDYCVNVNLSVVQLLQTDIAEVVKQTLQETGLKPENLTLEVTESLAINDMERVKGILNDIKKLGVKLALDDFGTGYSSLNHIREIDVDFIKVDQSFVQDLADDPYAKSFVKMIAELGEAIGVSICVEGIETKEQYNALQKMKINYIQGYYFDRPMPCEKFESKYVKKSATGIAKRK